MEFSSRYISKKPDADGTVAYSEEEHNVWKILFKRQIARLDGRACDTFIRGIQSLGLNAKGIPQLPDISKRLNALTGWQVSPVAALISAREFFELLATRHFPAATFIRCQEALDYVQEPDIFHEIFGHCPMLTEPVYADFVHDYAKTVLTFPEKEWPLLQRLFWFTVEFGLVQTNKGIRAYGGGILSSISEVVYSVESDIPLRVLFDPVVALRMPYRIDKLQPVYFVIQNYQQLFDFVTSDVHTLIERAHALGEFPPIFEIEDEGNPNIHIRVC